MIFNSSPSFISELCHLFVHYQLYLELAITLPVVTVAADSKKKLVNIVPSTKIERDNPNFLSIYL